MLLKLPIFKPYKAIIVVVEAHNSDVTDLTFWRKKLINMSRVKGSPLLQSMHVY